MKKVILSVALALALVGIFGGDAAANRDPKPGKAVDTIGANMAHSYSEPFQANKLAIITVKSDTPLALYVYDATGKLVEKDEFGLKLSMVMFTPKARGTYTIKVVNKGAASTSYTMLTN